MRTEKWNGESTQIRAEEVEKDNTEQGVNKGAQKRLTFKDQSSDHEQGSCRGQRNSGRKNRDLRIEDGGVFKGPVRVVVQPETLASSSRETAIKMMSALGARFYRTNSRQRESKEAIFVPLGYNAERSTSRGRDFLSTGRGGIGNLRPNSTSRDARPASGPDDFSVTRGREPHARKVEELYSTGRGGTGNIRSPSREHCKPDLMETSDDNTVRRHIADDENAPHSTGRGGAGNIHSRSRSRDATNASSSTLQSTGRGGVGNIHLGSSLASEVIDEEERHKLHPNGIHSTGRGGVANVTSAHEPNVEHHKHEAQNYESTGRGGVGNIVDNL